MPRDALGEFEQLVMWAVLRCGGSAYGVPVVREIQERTDRAASAASVYLALKRLEAKQYMTSTMSDPTPERGGKARRVFTVTPRGRQALLDSRAALQSMWAGVKVRPGEG